MQITCFSKGVDKFFDLVQENKVYAIIGGYIKLNDRKFYCGKNISEYRLILDENASIKEMVDDGSIENNTSCNFMKINKALEINVYSVVDLCVYVLECGEAQLKNTKNGEQYLRKLIVCDDSEYKIELTLWRIHATINLEKNQFLVIKNAKIGEFNGRNISSYDDTSILVNPQNYKEVEELKIFMENFRGEFKSLKNLNNEEKNYKENNGIGSMVYYMTEILDILDNDHGKNEFNTYKIKGTITQIIHNERNFYAGCPEISCKRKCVYNEQKDEWFCNHCSNMIKKPCYYYNLSIRVKDCSCEQWIDLFGVNAEKILKINAEDYRNLLLSGDSEKLKEINDNIEFKTFYFTIKPKIHMFNGNIKKKLYTHKLEPVDHRNETKRIIELLNKSL